MTMNCIAELSLMLIVEGGSKREGVEEQREQAN